jgi:Glu-tRNA(Gln) amidotransferase subunit E-like FAD-binding protein
MKKVILALAVYMLSGCALYDAYFMAKYDTNEYAAITQLRTQAEVAQESCADKKKTEQHINEMFITATYFKNFTQLRARNDDTSTIAYNLFLITEQLKKHYEKNETVSAAYCKLKMQQVEKNAISSQKIIGAKPR